MKCPKCGNQTVVKGGNHPAPQDGTEYRRYRRCIICAYQFPTIEVIDEPKPPRKLNLRWSGSANFTYHQESKTLTLNLHDVNLPTE